MGNAWSGSIWFYRPYFLECIDFENYRRIYNGNDTFIIECIKKMTLLLLNALKKKMQLKNTDMSIVENLVPNH